MHKLIVFILLLFSLNSFGQLSQGGFPLTVSHFKSKSYSDRVVRMPAFNADIIREWEKTDYLKPLKFAHSFPVLLSPDNSGEWFESGGFKIWKLEIESEGAYSLNIIFSKYYLPAGARLFVFDPEQKVILGAFTSDNNKPYKKLAIYPLPGDHLVVQYEEPVNAAFPGELQIGEVNHDYKNVFGTNNRFPRRTSEWCNVDVNCEFESGTEKQRRAVCRIIARDELGTGTLINNASNDGKPYLISALHVFDDDSTALVSLYDFNYESPFCTGLNGSDIQSVSGSVARASFDSLDFMFVELSETPPATYRPYYAGWDATPVPPSNSYTIHHPNGDTKKISHDTGKCDSIQYGKAFLKYGHWKIYNWEEGSSEGGSSGASLLNADKRIAGTLSGGVASCGEKSYDLFARFDKMWNYRKETNQQLKCWLDPKNTGVKKMNGYDPYSSPDEACNVFSNFMVEDTAVVLPVPGGSGFITGKNKSGITAVAEIFTRYDKAIISGVSLGIEASKILSGNRELNVRIYTGDSVPDFPVKLYKFSMTGLTSKAMNYLEFLQPIEVEGTFFVSIDIPTEDSLVLYQSALRPLVAKNTLMVLKNGEWKMMNEVVGSKNLGASLLLQVMVCGASASQPDSTANNDFFFKAYPSPASDFMIIEFKERAPVYKVGFYDMTGRLLFTDSFENRMYGEINTSGIPAGIYLLRVSNGQDAEAHRIVIR